MSTCPAEIRNQLLGEQALKPWIGAVDQVHPLDHERIVARPRLVVPIGVGTVQPASLRKMVVDRAQEPSENALVLGGVPHKSQEAAAVVAAGVAPGERGQRQPEAVESQRVQGIGKCRIGRGKVGCDVDLVRPQFEAGVGHQVGRTALRSERGIVEPGRPGQLSGLGPGAGKQGDAHESSFGSELSGRDRDGILRPRAGAGADSVDVVTGDPVSVRPVLIYRHRVVAPRVRARPPSQFVRRALQNRDGDAALDADRGVVAVIANFEDMVAARRVLGIRHDRRKRPVRVGEGDVDSVVPEGIVRADAVGGEVLQVQPEHLPPE